MSVLRISHSSPKAYFLIVGFHHNLLYTDPGIDDGIEHIYDEINNDKGAGNKQSPALDDHIVSFDHTIIEPFAHTRPGKYRFGQNRSTKEDAELKSHHSDDRYQAISKGMFQNDLHFT